MQEELSDTNAQQVKQEPEAPVGHQPKIQLSLA